MLEEIANIFYNTFNIEQVIDKRKEDLYKYGIQIFLTNIIEVIFTIIIGVVFSSVNEVFVFLCSFIITRRFTGGYHAKTFTRCTLLTSSVIVLSILIHKYIYISFNLCMFIGFFSLILFTLFVPIENENKKLDDELRSKCRIRAPIILLLQITIGYVLYHFNISSYSIIFISLIFVDIFIIISIKRKGGNHNEKDHIKDNC